MDRDSADFVHLHEFVYYEVQRLRINVITISDNQDGFTFVQFIGHV